MTSCTRALADLFPSTGDPTVEFSQVLTVFVLASPLIATLALGGVALMAAPPPLGIVDARRRRTRTAAVGAVTAAFALMGLLFFEVFDRLRCDSEAASGVANSVLRTTLVDLQYPVIVTWGCLYLFQVVGICCRSDYVAPFLSVLASAGVTVLHVPVGTHCPACAWPLFPLQLTLCATLSLHVLLRPYGPPARACNATSAAPPRGVVLDDVYPERVRRA